MIDNNLLLTDVDVCRRVIAISIIFQYHNMILSTICRSKHRCIRKNEVLAMRYDIVFYGNETLKQKAEEITNIDGKIIKLVDIMNNILFRNNGLGLAGPQIDVSKKIIVIDIENYKGPARALINPVIKERSSDIVPYDEGCLSIPGIFSEINRPSEIFVTGVTPEGKEVEIEADGLLARVLQHEIDHLNGIVFIDHLEKYQRDELRPRLKKIKKLNKKR